MKLAGQGEPTSMTQETDAQPITPAPLPHNLEAERAVLGACLIRQEHVDTARTDLRDGDWFRDAHRLIWRSMLRIHDAGGAVDLVTVCDDLTGRGVLDTVGGPAYVAALGDGVPRSTNVGHYAAIVARHGAERQALLGLQNGAPAAGVQAALERAQRVAAPAVDLDTLAPTLGNCEARSEEVSWLWTGRIPRGALFAVTGAPDAGKSLTCAALAAAVSSGLAMPGDHPREPGRVVWIGAEDEDQHGLVVARLRAAGADPERTRVYRAPESPVSIAAICRTIRESQPDLVIVDSHVSWFRESNDGPAVRAELQAAFRDLLRDGCAVGLVAHWRKSSVEDGPQHFRTAGSNMGLIGAVRSVLEVEKRNGDDAGTLRTVKHNAGPQPDDVRYQIESHGEVGIVVWAGTAPHTPREPGGGSGPSDKEILDVLEAADDPLTLNGMRAPLKMKSRVQQVALKASVVRLTESGVLDTVTVKRRGNEHKAYVVLRRSNDVERRISERRSPVRTTANDVNDVANAGRAENDVPDEPVTDRQPDPPEHIAPGSTYPLVAALDWTREQPRGERPAMDDVPDDLPLVPGDTIKMPDGRLVPVLDRDEWREIHFPSDQGWQRREHAS